VGLDIPDRCKRQPMDGAVVYSPNNDFVEVDFEKTVGWILERKQFDKWLAERAAKAGAKIQAKTEVVELLEDNKGVVARREGQQFEEKAKMVIAADGVESLIAREAGIKKPSQLNLVDSGYQYEMVNIDLKNPNKIELYFGNEIAPRGYVWIFPKGDRTANVGIGIAGNSDKTAKEYLDKFIEDRDRLKQGSILEVNSGMIPVGGLLDNMVADNCLAIGDAANQVNPIHGGGISESIRASRIASKVIHKALKEGDTGAKKLQEYNVKWWEERGNKLRKIEKLREVIEKLDNDDLNYLAEELDGKDLVKASRGKKLSKVGKLLLKRPKMIKAARKLI
jgi:digeranylgeranylglycerophospholipid reductase